MASLRSQTPSTRRIAPVPETRTFGEPQCAKFPCDQRVVSETLDRVEGEGRPVLLSFADSKSPAKLALPKAALIANAAIALGKMRRVSLVIGECPIAFGSRPISSWLGTPRMLES